MLHDNYRARHPSKDQNYSIEALALRVAQSFDSYASTKPPAKTNRTAPVAHKALLLTAPATGFAPPVKGTMLCWLPAFGRLPDAVGDSDDVTEAVGGLFAAWAEAFAMAVAPTPNSETCDAGSKTVNCGE